MLADGLKTTTEYVCVDNVQLETHHIRYGSGVSTIVLLHEGLGCCELWRDFPKKLALQQHVNVLTYSRSGHGRSQPPTSPREIDYLHKEALIVLPQVIADLDLKNPVLFGHSDGASIALLYAASFPSSVAAVIAEAPHLFVEDITLQGIREAGSKFEQGLGKRLCKYHDDAKSLFYAWHDTWLSESFHKWNIEPYISSITCPVLAIQGADDQYGTLRQIERIKELAQQTELLVIPDCGHAPHQEKQEIVLKAISRFLAQTN